MKNFTLLFLCVGLCVNSFAVKHTSFGSKISKNKFAEEIFYKPGEKSTTVKVLRKPGKDMNLMLPGTIEIYFSIDGESWDLESTSACTYNSDGKILTETITYSDGSVSKYTYTYDKNGMKTSYLEQAMESEESGNLENIQRKFWEYDPVVTDFVTKQEYQSWNANTNAWEQAYLHTKVIERNKQGDVESVETRLYFANTDQYDVMEQYEMLFNDRNLVSTIIKKTLTEIAPQEYGLEEAYRFTNLEWAQCGQVLSTENLSYGTNLAKSYDIIQNGEKVATNRTTYSPAGELFSSESVLTYIDNATETFTHKLLDNNGSYEQKFLMQFEDEIMGEKYIEKYDEYKTLTEGSYYVTEDGELWDMGESNKYIPAYDGNKMTEMIFQMYNYDSGEYESVQKDVYSNHIPAAVNHGSASKNMFFDPANNTIVISENDVCSYSVYAINGTLVKSGQAKGKIDMSSLAKGAYIIRIQTGQSNMVLKFIK